MVIRPGVVRSSNALCVISIQLGMPCGRQRLRTRKGRPAFSSAIMCWICGRTSGFQGGTFAVSRRFWSLTSGSHTPLKSGGSAKARETTNISINAAAQQKIASFFATIFTPTNRCFSTPCVVRSTTRSKSHMPSGWTIWCGVILVTAIRKERLSGRARLHHSERGAFYRRRGDRKEPLIAARRRIRPSKFLRDADKEAASRSELRCEHADAGPVPDLVNLVEQVH